MQKLGSANIRKFGLNAMPNTRFLIIHFTMQFSRKTGSAVPTRWSEEEIEIALEGEKLSLYVKL